MVRQFICRSLIRLMLCTDHEGYLIQVYPPRQGILWILGGYKQDQGLRLQDIQLNIFRASIQGSSSILRTTYYPLCSGTTEKKQNLWLQNQGINPRHTHSPPMRHYIVVGGWDHNYMHLIIQVILKKAQQPRYGLGCEYPREVLSGM